MEINAAAYDHSVREVADLLDIKLQEIDDWNCCGASAAHGLNHDLAVALPYRTLALAQKQGLTEVLAPCAACFSRLKGTVVRLKRNPDLVQKMREITGHEYAPSTVILNIVEFVNRLLADGLAAKLTAPLGGWKAVAYYGCLLSRGEGIIEGEDPENPVGMEAAIRAAGCDVMPWNFATECCGGGFSMSKTEAVLGLSSAILTEARDAGAQIIVTGCPMCHSNLDMRQKAINAAGQGLKNMPVLYLSELMGLAAGIDPKSLGLNRHFVDAMTVVPRSK